MNFSLFLLTATTKWSLRLVYMVELLQLLLVEAQALIPMLQGDDGGSDSSSNALECVVRLPPPAPLPPSAQTATKRRACCLLVLHIYLQSLQQFPPHNTATVTE